MSDQFRLSSDVVDEQVAEALDGEGSVIDPTRPGFASLLEVMRGARAESVERSVQVAYFQGLKTQLDQTRHGLESMTVPEQVAESVAPAIQATRGMLGDMEEVLNLFGDWLAAGKVEVLDRAIAILEAVQREILSAATMGRGTASA